VTDENAWYDGLFDTTYFDVWLGGRADRMLTAERTQAEVEFIERALGLPAGSSILDLCCGHGRHALLLAERGYRVTGVDFSQRALRLARRHSRRAGLDVRWLKRDMRRITFREEFDAVINIFTAFGYFEPDSENEEVLRRVAAALKPGGLFLIDDINRDWLVRSFESHRWHQATDGTLMLEDVNMDLLAGRCRTRWTAIAPDGSRRHGRVDLRVYTLREFAGMLERSGLRFRQVWGGFDGQDYSLDSRRMIVLAEKAVASPRR
jgi:SAM-dependent methyltransferase